MIRTLADICGWQEQWFVRTINATTEENNEDYPGEPAGFLCRREYGN
jgi:hypothetical protein